MEQLSHSCHNELFFIYLFIFTLIWKIIIIKIIKIKKNSCLNRLTCNKCNSETGSMVLYKVLHHLCVVLHDFRLISISQLQLAKLLLAQT